MSGSKMTDLETLVIEMAAGLKLLAGMLGLTVALLPEADRAVVLKSLAALQNEGAPAENTDEATTATSSTVEAAKTLAALIENFTSEIAATRGKVKPD